MLPGSPLQTMISVIAPVYGNGATLVELQCRLQIALEGLGAPYELIFVNDASPDDSGEVLKQLASQSPHVKVISLARNVGQNMAIRVGLTYAYGERFVVLDADLQDEPEYIPQLLGRLVAPYAVVFATRAGNYHANGFDALTSKVFKKLFGSLSRNALPEGTGLFLALNRELRDRIVKESDGWPYLIGFIARSGLPATSLPVQRQLRASGKSSYTFWRRARLAVQAFIYTFSPLAGRARTPKVILLDESK